MQVINCSRLFCFVLTFKDTKVEKRKWPLNLKKLYWCFLVNLNLIVLKFIVRQLLGPFKYYFDTDLSEIDVRMARAQMGINCQHWDSQYPHKPTYGKPEKFPEGDVSKAKNYCSDSSGHGKPWCYTTDQSKRWELCCVNNCSDLE
jgi:hypothetical protein